MTPGFVASPTTRLQVGSRVRLVDADGAPHELTGKAAVVLAWVALEGHAERRRLAGVLWPQSDGGQARSNLRVLVHRINQRCGGELLVGAEQLTLEPTLVGLQAHDPEAVLAELDAGGAERCELLAQARVEAEAGEELLAWLEGARLRLRRLQLAALSEALAETQAGAHHERALVLARACVQLDPLSEHRHRQLMELLVRGGDRAAALSAYEACKTLLRQHLGVLPDLQTRSLQLRILQEQAQGPAPMAAVAPAAERAPATDGLTALGGAARYPLVERDEVLAQAHAALQLGQHVVIQGEPGVGKTRLLRHLMADVGAGAEAVAIHSGLQQEPYAAVAQLLQEVQPRRAAPVGVPEQIELARLAPLVFAGVQPSEAPLSASRLHAALRQWLARLGETGVRVLVLDDLHYADAASQAALASLLDMPPPGAAGATTLLLGCRRGEIGPVLDEAVTQAQTRHRARRIELPRLTAAGVQALLGAMGAPQGADDGATLAGQLLKRTGGNPLFVIELARHAHEQGGSADMASLQALLGSSLQLCGAAAQQLAAVAAVAAEDFTIELASAVLAQPALALMPAWGALQQRGLFAEHGLAHDLVQEAVLATLPQALCELLHKQVAQHLESLGSKGAAVLRHWLAANDPQRALPHAVHQLHARAEAGLPTAQQESDMLGLLERADDTTLMDNLWLTAEIDNSITGGSVPQDVWRRLRALRLRVERLPQQPDGATWVAFEASRDCYNLQESARRAYDCLAPVAERMPERGVERAYVELALAAFAVDVTGDPRAHLLRARQALVGLPEQLSIRRLRMEADDAAARLLAPAEGLRAQAARCRAGRRRGDLELAADASLRMGLLHQTLGSDARAFAHYCRAARTLPGDSEDASRFRSSFGAGVVAMNAGHYRMARILLSATDERWGARQPPLFRALLHLRLGERAQAGLQVAQVDEALLERHMVSYFAHAYLCAELDRFEGRDPVPALIRRMEHTREFGITGILAERMTWEIMRCTQPAAQRLQAGDALLRGLAAGGGSTVRPLIEVAEARAEAGAQGVAELAVQAARYIRRGCAPVTLYVPEGLLRCARLILPADPREAAALVHVARRWVRDALQRVPPESRDSFMHDVAVNRLLLGEDEAAVLEEPLR
jgi:DNA-binding SARP family transcriptional activator